MSNAVTRKEAYLKSIGDGTSSALKPITREEQYLAYIAGESNSFPTNPITREEALLDKIAKKGAGGGGSSINVQPLNATANGTYDAPEGQAYDPVTVDVKPITEPITITENGVYPVPKGSGEVKETVTADSEFSHKSIEDCYRIDCPIADIDAETFDGRIDSHYKVEITFNDGTAAKSFYLDGEGVSEGGLVLMPAEGPLAISNGTDIYAYVVAGNLKEVIGDERYEYLKNYFPPNTILVPQSTFTNLHVETFSVTYGTKNLDGWGDITVNVAGGEKNVIAGFLEGTITEINSSDVKSITTGATAGLDSLVSVSLPNLETITSSGFSGCDNLKNVNLPQLKTVRDRTFRDCKALTSLSLPEVTEIGQNCFAGCISLENIYLPKLRTLGQYMIQNSKVKSISFPEVVSPASSAFEGSEFLETVDLPKITNFYNRMFFSCYALKNLNAPVVTQIANYTFQNCFNIERLDFPIAHNIGQRTFSTCRSLKTLILRGVNLCSLSNVNTFENCYHFHGTVDETYNPNGDKDGYIYVPSAQLENYKVATNWSTYADRFRAIEDYPEITGG